MGGCSACGYVVLSVTECTAVAQALEAVRAEHRQREVQLAREASAVPAFMEAKL